MNKRLNLTFCSTLSVVGRNFMLPVMRILKSFTFLSKRINLLPVIIVGFLLFFPGLINKGYTQIQTFTSNGTFIVPAGVTQVTVECWGGGGGGFSADANPSAGGGGGGGAYAKSVLSVIPGNPYDVVVGIGGAAESNGGNSTFNGSSVVAAAGSGSTSTTGGMGGTFNNSTGTIRYPGGNGGNSSGTAYSGGGGGGAGSNGAGGNASGATAGTGTSSNGGNGGAGITYHGDGINGLIYGGGGSGSLRDGGPKRTGGMGSNGQVVISWVLPPSLSVVPANLDFGYIMSGGTSSEQTYTLSGANLTGAPGSISVSAPSNFEVSLTSGSGFGSSVSVPFASSTLAARTIYARFKPTSVNTIYSGNISNTGGGVTVNVAVSGTSILAYCTPEYATGTGSGDYISLVQLGSINNSTGASPAPFFTYYSGLSTDLVSISSYNITLSAGTYPTGNNISVWIDYNHNGIFEVSEKLGNITPGPMPATATINFTVPAGAISGTTRMRVREVYNEPAIDPCMTYVYGETEDYNVNILPAITTGTITGSPFCAGSAVSIPFTISGTFSTGNVFSAQMSNAGGSFASPVNIGTLTSTVAGTISGTIPAGTTSGTGYRIRVVGSAPSVQGTNNGSNLTVNADLPVSVSIAASANPVCAGTSVSFTATPVNGGTTPAYQWKVNGVNAGTNSATYSYTPANNDAVSCVLTSNVSPCATGNPATSNTITMTVNASPVASINYAGSPYCSNAGIVPVTLTGAAGGTFSAIPAGLSINPVSGQINTLLSTPGSYTVTYTLAAAGGCGEVTTTASVVIIAGGIWSGSISTDWNTTGNWECNSLPLITTNVVIPGSLTNYPVLNPGTPGSANNITLHTGATLIVSGNTLQIAGIVSNSGTLTASDGTIEMKGAVSQAIGANLFAGNTIKNLTVSNPSGVTLEGLLNVSGVLLVQNGNLSTGGFLTLLSSPTQTALIDGSGNGGVMGNVTMQRYLPSGFGYKYVSSPFRDATVGGFSEEIDLSASFPAFYRYDENRDATGWVSYIDQAGALLPMVGYTANSGNLSEPKTLSLTGIVSNGIQGPMVLYNHDKTYTKGFNLLGNPYPSPIDWNAVNGWARTNIDNAIYYFNTGDTSQYKGIYSSYNNGVSSDGVASNLIPSMQGFFVHVTDGSYPVSGSIGMDNRVRINDLSPVYHKNALEETRPIIRLSAAFDGETDRSDQLAIYFDNAATARFDKEFDALKLYNTDEDVPSLYALSEEQRRLSIGAFPFPQGLGEIPLGLNTARSGNITFRLSLADNIPADYSIYLKDKVSGKTQNLSLLPEYTIPVGSGALEGRLSVILSTTDISQGAFGSTSFNAYAKDGSLYVYIQLKEEQVNVQLTNMAGQLMLQRTLYDEGHHRIGNAPVPGIYLVTIFTDLGTISKKIYLQ